MNTINTHCKTPNHFCQLMLSCFMLFGFAPMMSAPPSIHMPAGQTSEVGYSVNGGAAFQETPLHDLAHMPPPNGALAHIQFHYRYLLDDGYEVGNISTIGYPSIVSTGVYLRTKGVSNDIFSLSGQAEFGINWCGIRLPMSLKLDDDAQFTTQPTIVLGPSSAVSVPLGISRTLANGWRLDSEIGTRYLLIDSVINGRHFGPWSLIGQVGISYHGTSKPKLGRSVWD